VEAVKVSLGMEREFGSTRAVTSRKEELRKIRKKAIVSLLPSQLAFLLD